MAFLDVHWYSNVLCKQVAMYMILPSVGKPPFPVFYLLHGLSDDHTIWHRRTRIEQYVRDLPLMVVMPDGFRGFYTDANQGPAYAKYVGEELPQFVERNFAARRTGKARCIGGLSMGGYGALRLALGYPGKYVSANSHSGALMLGHYPCDPKDKERCGIFGRSPRGSNHDLVHLARRAKTARTLPAIRIDCGTEDFLLEQNRAYRRQLQKLDIPHEYAEYPGGHSWDYWDVHVQEALQFHARALGIKPAVSSQ